MPDIPAAGSDRDRQMLQWYTRRGGVIRGPYDTETVSRHILLGRILSSDELSSDGQGWKPASSVSGLVPPVMTGLTGWADYRQFLEARAHADERCGERRASGCTGCGRCGGSERRVQADRRRPVQSDIFRRRPLRSGQGLRAGGNRYLLYTLLTASFWLMWPMASSF